METKEFKEKACKILETISELAEVKFTIKDKWEKDYKESLDYEISNQIREFKHLVYAFDKELPLYQELKDSVYPPQNGQDLEKWRKGWVSWYAERIRFFIHYIEEYVEVKPNNSQSDKLRDKWYNK